MHNGKYRRKRKKWVMLTVAMLLLLAAGVGGSIAYLLDKTDMVNNTFTPGRVTVDIAEEKTPTTKSNIRVQNTGNVPAYIRVTLVTYWTDADNKVVPQPDGGSVSTPSVKPGWSCADNIYYYNSSVAPGDLTDAMLDPITIQAPSGYTCHIDVYAEGIQAEGIQAGSAVNAWAAAKGG